jgi:hypothetical protein
MGYDMHDDTLAGGEAAAAGISRRDLLRKGAVVGGAGALLWAAPSITKFGGAAFGAEGTPASDFSNFGAIVLCTHTSGSTHLFKGKSDQEGDLPNFTWKIPGNLGGCEDLTDLDWGSAEPKHGANDLGMTFVQSGSNYILSLPSTPPAGYTGCTFAFTQGSGVASSLKQGQCCIAGAVSADGQKITWFWPFPNGNQHQPPETPPELRDPTE